MRIWDFLFERKEESFVESEFLYYYTSFDTFCKFVANGGDFYCTNYKMLNDASEMAIGVDFVCDYLQKKLNWANESVSYFREVYLKSIASENVVIPWVMSFSRVQDSLHQWMAYTDSKQGGVAVGIRRAQLWSALDRDPGRYSKLAVMPDGTKGRNRAFELRLLPCLYAIRDKLLIEDLVAEMLSPHLSTFARMGKTITLLRPDDLILAINAVLELSAVIKHDAFNAEEEERLILLPMTRSVIDCEMIGGKKRWRTYLSEVQKEGVMSAKYRGLRGIIREVVISPHGNHDELLDSVQRVLTENDMTFCRIEKSRLPYKGS